MSQNNISPVSSQTGATSKLDAALAHARHGFPVFPLVPNAKKPLIENWPNLSTTEANQIRTWWHQRPDANIGIHTANYLVVDIDPRKGGDASFDALQLTEGFPDTVVTATQGGGAHLIYALPEHTVVRGGADKLAQGIDIKSYGGFVVAPGSTIDGRPYKWAEGCSPDDRKPATAPDWIVRHCAMAARSKTLKAGQRVIEEDETALAMAIDYIERFSPSARIGNRGFTAYKVAARLFDFGVSSETAKALLEEVWSPIRCDPPMPQADVIHAVNSAERNRENAIGSRHPNAPGFEPYEIGPAKAEAPANKFHLVAAEDGARRALETVGTPLVEGLLHRGAMSVLIGAPGGGKTFLTLDLCYHIATGKPWAGHDVHRGAVVYLAAEAGNTIMARLAALKAHYGSLDGVPLFVIPQSADMANNLEDTLQIVSRIKDLEARLSLKVEMFVIDTLARAISGRDENTAQDMGAVIKAADLVRERCQTHSMIIHHPGKDESKGGRGSSALLGATDTEMQIQDRMLTFTKQRDMELADPIAFTLKPIEIGRTDSGKPITSCYVEARNMASDGFEPAPLPTSLQILLGEMRRRIQFRSENEGLPIEECAFGWKFVEECTLTLQNTGELSADIGKKRPTFLLRLSEMSAVGAVKKSGHGQYVMTNVSHALTSQPSPVPNVRRSALSRAPTRRQAPHKTNSQPPSTSGYKVKAA